MTQIEVQHGETQSSRPSEGENGTGAPNQSATMSAREEDSEQAYKDRWLRAKADLDNLRKRTSAKITAEREDARDRLLKEFLVIVDSLERALDHSRGSENPWHEGMEIMHRQMMELFQRHGMVAFGKRGDVFDPHLHEALSCVERDDLPPGTVAKVIERGYRIQNGRLLRPAKVIAAQKNPT